ncbi:MAG: hypothetical protein JSV99_00185, partial [Planctomycetota bacterium]
MTASALSKLLGSGDLWAKTFNYEIIEGNAIWRFLVVLLVIVVALAAGRIAQYFITSYASRREEKYGATAVTIFVRCVAKPVSVAIFALGLFLCKASLVFGEEAISPSLGDYWIRISKAIAAIAIAYAVYRLVDVVEYYLLQWTSRTKTKL